TEALTEAGDVLGEQPRVVSLASTSGIAGNRGQTNYATSKAGVIAFVDALAERLERIGGTANAVAPGFIETEMTARMPALNREPALLEGVEAARDLPGQRRHPQLPPAGRAPGRRRRG